MTPSTADQVLTMLARYALTAKPGGRYLSNSPLRPGSNSHALSLIINGPEHGAYLDFVSGEKGSLYDLAAKLGIATPKKTDTTERRLVATYDYCDADGRLVYQACRHEPGRDGRTKDFSQRVPDGTSDWRWSMTGVTRVLYRLPEVLAAVAAGELVYIVEGEKDADQLTLYGLTATTNVGGAGKWKRDYSAALAGAHVVILPDNDAPGATHGDTVAASLDGVAASLKVVTLPGLPPKGDVSDWLAAGNTIDELHALVAATAAYTPPPPAAAPDAAPRLGPTARLAHALLNAGYHCVLNTETDEIAINGELMSDITRALLRSDVRDRELGATTILDDAVVLQAKQHAHAPIRDGLAALTWDGGAHISRLAACLLTDAADTIPRPNQPPQRAAEAFLTRWLLGAVGRVLDGDQNAMLVLDGPQGIGKSVYVKWLGSVLPGVYCEESISPQEKDCLLRLTRTLVWEAGELDGTTRKHDVAALKHFLTRTTVTARRSYGRHDITKPVLTSFIGTVNTSGNGFLPDPTGNRRYLVLTLTGIDWSYTKLDPRQVWAEAVARYQRGERGRLTAEEASYRDTVNAERHQLTGLMDDWLSMHFLLTGTPSDMLTSGEIAAHLATKDIRLGGNDRAAAIAIADALTRAGVVKADRRAAQRRYGSFQRAWAGIQTKDRPYVPPDDDAESDPVDPIRSNRAEIIGSAQQDAANPESDPIDPIDQGNLGNCEETAAEPIADDLRALRAAQTPKVHGSLDQPGSRHQNAEIQLSGRLDRIGSTHPVYKPSVDERMKRIKATRALLRDYGTPKELSLNLDALSWAQLSDLHTHLSARQR